MKDYIVVLSGWKRTDWLLEQLFIFKTQTVKPKEIWLCFGKNDTNSSVLQQEYIKYFDKVKVLEDGGSVFSRFEMCYDGPDCYYFVIDDDMFPTSNYCESCLKYIEANGESILASSGRIFHGDKYFPNTMVGSTRYSGSCEVHIGTNGWFLSRESIRCLMDNRIQNGYNNGEDIALSFLNRSLREIKTCVTKQTHYVNSDRYKHQRGFGEEALSHQVNHKEFYRERNEMLKQYRDRANHLTSGFTTFKHEGKPISLKSLASIDHQVKSWKTGRFYETNLLNKIRSLGIRGTYLDIGANVGNHTVYMSLLSDAYEVLSFEPHPEIFKCLNENVAKNKCDNVRTYNVGLGSESGKLKMSDIDLKNCGSTKISEDGSVEVDIITLDSLDLTDVSLIKIDVEGFEANVIDGSLKTIEKNKPILITEAATKQEFDLLKGKIEPLGYRTDGLNYAATPTFIWRPIDE